MKKTITQLTNDIDAYSALVDPLSIDPTLDGGIKKNILETLNNKARSQPVLRLSSVPSNSLPDSQIGNNNEYYLYSATTPVIVYFKSSGVWNPVQSSNDMFFFNDGEDGVRRFYSLSDDLLSIVLVHEIDFGDISGSAVKFTAQTLTPLEQEQARLNIDAAAKAYVDNLFNQLIRSGATGTECAGTVKPWFGLASTIPTSWNKINDTQTWYSKTEYPDLYVALGGENNPWGVTTTSFSIPYAIGGTSFVKEGVNFAVFSVGGETEHLLTAAESGLPAHSHNADLYDPNPDFGKNHFASGQGTPQYYNGSGSTEPSSAAPAIEAHENMPPYTAVFYIIKLSNSSTGDITNYDSLTNKPKINSIELSGNKTLGDLGIQPALGFTPENAANKGAVNGYAPLDNSGKVPSANLPSYVDDVIEVSDYASLPNPGEQGKIYITLDTNSEYRWSGTVYVSLSNPLDIATQAEAEAGTNNSKAMTPLRVLQSIVYQIINLDFSGLLTTSKKIVGAINELFSIKQNNLPFPETPAGNFLSDSGAFLPVPSGSGGYSADVYFTNVNSATAGYKKSSTINDVAQTEKSIVANNNTVQGEKYLFDAQIGISQIPSGNWKCILYGRVSSSALVSTVSIRFFRYTLAGAEIDLFTMTSADINDISNAKLTVEYNPGVLAIDPTDRVGHQISLTTTRSSNTTFYYEVGNGYAAYINTPLPHRHSESRQPNEVLAVQHVDTTTEKASPIDADSVGLWDSVAGKFVLTTVAHFKSKFLTEWFGHAMSDLTTDIVASTTVPKAQGVIDYPITITQITYSNLLAHSGGSFLIDIKKSLAVSPTTFTSIFTTLLSVDSGKYSSVGSTPYVLATTPLTFAVGDQYQAFITQVGSVVKGQGGILKIYYTRN